MILAIESSCDESAVALFDPHFGLCGELIHSQLAVHAVYGGVVPDLASREHVEALTTLLASLQKNFPEELSRVTEVVVTVGPGLAGCLAVGVALAQGLGLACGIPVRGVNHLRGHAFSPFIPLHRAAILDPRRQREPSTTAAATTAPGETPSDLDRQVMDWSSVLPHLGLVVSGGNTILLEIDEARKVHVLAQTADDAAGEALDKGAKLLALPYPGGPEIEKHGRHGDARRVDFPTGLADPADLRFSFSGLKTSLRYRLEKMTDSEVSDALPDLCASYQAAVIDQLCRKTRQALQSRGLPLTAAPVNSPPPQRGAPPDRNSQYFKSLGLSGGVANNAALREAMQALAKNFRLPCLLADRQHTGDNAGMIAFAAWADPHNNLTADAIHPSLPIDAS